MATRSPNSSLSALAELDANLAEYSRTPTPTVTTAEVSPVSRWFALTTVSGAALAMATGADASVVYSGLRNIGIPLGFNFSVVGIDIDGLNGDDFALVGTGTDVASTYTEMSVVVSTFSRSVAAGIAALGGAVLADFGLLRNEPESNVITASAVTSSFGTIAGASSGGLVSAPSASAGGNFLPAPDGTLTGIAGFKLAGGELGWLRLSVTRGSFFPTSVTVVDWAYESVPGVPIHVAATSGGMEVPEPSTCLAGLAMGAAAVSAYRQRRKAAVATQS